MVSICRSILKRLMLEKIQEGYDLVIGSRFVTEKKPKSTAHAGEQPDFSGQFIPDYRESESCDPTSGMRLFNQEHDSGICAVTSTMGRNRIRFHFLA